MNKLFSKYVSRNVAGVIGISAYILVDTFFISLQAGSDGITVLNLVLPLYGLIFAIGSMLGIGAATRFALDKAQGNNNTDGYFTHTLIWQLIFSIPFVALGIISPGSWIYMMGGDKHIVQLGIDYIRLVLMGTPFFMMNYSFTAFARNDNAPTIAMTAALVASGFNIVFDYIFMFPMKMGLAGAALATAMAPAVSGLICCVHYFSPKATVKLRKVRLSVRLIVSCGKLGVSAFVGEASGAVTTVAFNSMLLSIAGNIGVAAYGIVANLSAVAMAIFNGIAQGMQPLVSRSFGQGSKKEANGYLRLGIYTCIAVVALILAVSWGMTDTLAGIFNSEGNAKLQEYANAALRLYSLGFVFAGINVLLTTYFSATGNALSALIASVLRGAAATIPCTVIMALLWNVTGVWLSFMAAESITFAVIIILLCRQKRSGKNEPEKLRAEAAR